MPEKPAPDTAPSAAQAEAEGATTATITWEGVTVTFPSSVEQLDPDVLEAFENEKAITAVRGLLGSDEYERVRAEFLAKHSRKLAVGDLAGLMELVAEALGFGTPGE